MKQYVRKCISPLAAKRLVYFAIFAGFIFASGYAGLLFASNNFHVVVPGALYRSAQPDAAEIEDYKARYGLKTVINLRGANPGRRWYKDELAASARAGITHIDFGMSARKLQPREKIARLITILNSAEKPILIHCESGADRTGLVSALYLAAIEKRDENAAEAQLSIRYGHIGIPMLSQAYPMDQSFEEVKGMLGYSDTASNNLLKKTS
uniref:Tyrosine phosphatase family protein n=1 Tax=Rhizobium rhizogenes TaxID=359 RepID=A0A7S4ZVD3_RHIRH|nr:tyrosine phosphatase family protein [Rhizobium rhizogenes]